MASEQSTLRFANQDKYTLALLARVQRETGYVPTMAELTKLLQCPTTAAARQCLDELVASGEGTRLTPEERKKVVELAERHQRNALPDTQHRLPDRRHHTHSQVAGRPHVRWARSE